MNVATNIWDDFGFFSKDENLSVFDKINFTQTSEGKHFLKYLVTHPLEDLEKIIDRQATIQFLQSEKSAFSTMITNGSLLVVSSFYETRIADIPKKSSSIKALFFKLFNPTSFSLCKYSVQHFFILLEGMNQLHQSLKKAKNPYLISLSATIETALQLILKNDLCIPFASKKTSNAQVIQYAYFFKHKYKKNVARLISCYAQLDAYRSLGIAAKKYNWSFPDFCMDSNTIIFDATDLHHPLIPESCGYTFQLTPETPFLFLTGANMAGKSTFIKSIGIALLLAQMGMAVPAKKNVFVCYGGHLT